MDVVGRHHIVGRHRIIEHRQDPELVDESCPFLVRQRVGTQLEVDGERLGTLAVLHQPGRAVTARAPQAAALPAGFRVIDAPVEAFGIEAQRIGHRQKDHLAVFQRDQPVMQVGGGHRHVLAEAERVVLIDP
jgi:hypothetical protein